MKTAVIALILPVILFASAHAQDEAEYSRWKLDITYGIPDFVVLKDVHGDTHLVWYLLYTVTNNTDDDVPLRIKIKAVTDTKRTYHDSIAPLAQRELKKQTGKDFMNAIKMNRGNLAAGAKAEGVAFFGDLDPNFDTLKVRISGLYDTVDQVDGKLYHENKVLVVTYLRPGDEFGSARDIITKKGEEWVLEGERTEIPQTSVD